MQSIVGYKFQSDIALAAEAEGRVKGEAEGRVKGEAEGRVKGEAEGRARGEAEGRVKGEAEGRARGEAEGRATGLAEAVLELLDSHDAVVDDAERKLIMECHDPATLKAWLVRAVSASSAAEVLAENGHTDAS